MKKLLVAVVVFFVVLAGGITAVVMLFDVNTYRGQIAEALTEQLGRSVKLGGPIRVRLSTHGVVLEIQDAAIGNPTWASRPNMANIGRFKLAVDLLPLIGHQLVVTGMEIDNADILLESSPGDTHNWDFTSASMRPVPHHPLDKSSPETATAISINSIIIANSQIGIRGADGKTILFKAETMRLGREGTGMALHFTGQYNSVPINLTLLTSADDLTSKAIRPVDIDLAFSNLRLKAIGKASLGEKEAKLDSYEVTADKSSLSGQLAVSWGGAKPSLKGTLVSDHLAPADFKLPESDQSESSAPASDTPAEADEHVFSDTFLDLSGLKSANADFDMTIAELPLGSVTLTQISGKLAIENGRVAITPFKAALGSGEVNGQINLDATQTPPHLGATFVANSVDISDLMQIGGIEAFLTGKVNANLNIVSSGNSLHEFASNTSGSVNVIGAGGDVVNSAADKMSAGLSDLFAPGTGNANASMNCIVARFTAANGIVRDNGILVDTTATTVAGNGGFDLRSETIDLLLHAKPKGVNTGGLLPPLHVGGTFLHPSFGVSAATVVQNVAGYLTGGSLGGNTLGNSVPNITTQQGQNACLYTLDHPTASGTAAKQPQGGVVQDLAGKAGQTINQLVPQLKGLLGQ